MEEKNLDINSARCLWRGAKVLSTEVEQKTEPSARSLWSRAIYASSACRETLRLLGRVLQTDRLKRSIRSHGAVFNLSFVEHFVCLIVFQIFLLQGWALFRVVCVLLIRVNTHSWNWSVGSKWTRISHCIMPFMQQIWLCTLGEVRFYLFRQTLSLTLWLY